MSATYNTEKSMISKEVVLDMLNGNNISECIIISFGKYIAEAASISITDADGFLINKEIDKDLFQDISINVIQCLPNLKKKLERYMDEDDSFTIVF